MNNIDIFTVAEARDFLDKHLLAAMMREPEILHDYGIREGSLYLGGFAEAENLFVLVRQDLVEQEIEKRFLQIARFVGYKDDEAIAGFLEKVYAPVKDGEHITAEQDCYLSVRQHFYNVSYWLERVGGLKATTEMKTIKLVASVKILQLTAKELEQSIAEEALSNPAFEMEEIETEE